MSNDVRIFRRSAIPTAIVGVILVALGAVLYGTRGLLGGLVAVAVVTGFFAISLIVINRVARISPNLMMGAALGSFLVKFVALALLAMWLRNVTALNGRYFGITALTCVLVWCISQVVTFARLRIPYVEPQDGLRSGGRQ